MAILNSTLRLSLLDQVSGRAKVINASLNSIKTTQAALMGTMGRLAAFGGAYLGVTQGVSGTVGAALNFESAFADVAKVMNANEEQLSNVRTQIIGMSKELPIAASGIAEIFAAAAQSNIPMEELAKFSEMAAKVSTAWDIPVGETGQALAEIKNQLNLGVTDVGLFADSLNHLSNTTAATAPRLLEYTKRVAATGEMFGFNAQQTLAFGGAMIAAGGESEVAATSFRNMGRALTIGERATKSHREAYKKLGLDSVKVAKSMQKNALGTTLDVLEMIQKLPEWQQISIAGALFGDEARALMPIINNSTELRRQLGLVGDQANYAGSAFEEYTKRASTTGNVLQILQNKVADLFRSAGDRMLPRIKEAALGIGDVIDTLGERAHIFSQMDAAMQGFLKGFGVEGGVRDLINDLGDLLFGDANGSEAADKIGRIFVKFRQWGEDIRALSTAVAENPIAQFFAQLAPYGGQIMLWGAGIVFLAGTIRKLAAALMLLSGASTILAALKAVGGIAAIAGGGTAAAGATGVAAGAAGTAAAGAGAGLMTKLLGFARMGVIGAAAGGLWSAGKEAYTGDTPYARGQSWLPSPTDALHGVGSTLASMPTQSAHAGVYAQMAMDAARAAQGMGLGGSTDRLPGKTADDLGPIRIDAGSIAEMARPSGIQDVRDVNKQPPHVTVNAPITISGVSDPKAAASAAAAELGQVSRNAYESAYTD